MSGKHLVVDVDNIIDYQSIEKVEKIKLLMEKIIQENN